MPHSALAVDPTVLLGQLALSLANPDRPVSLADALALLVSGLDLRSAVVQDPQGGTRAVAGDTAHAVPPMRGAGLPSARLSLPLPGTTLSLRVVGAEPDQLAVLRSAAAVLGLALGTDSAAPEGDSGALDADLDGDRIADDLHDGPVQALVAARYACDAAIRAADGNRSRLTGLARDAVQEAVVGLRQTMWHLRSRATLTLADSLSQLSERLVEGGGPGLLLSVAPDAGVPRPACRALVYRLVQEASRSAAGALRVDVGRADDAVRVEVAGRPVDLARWRSRCADLGVELSETDDGVQLHLPVPASSPHHDPAPSETEARS